jgi:hypothetical protein
MLWTLKCRHVHNTPLLVTTLSLIYLRHTLPSNFIKMHFNNEPVLGKKFMAAQVALSLIPFLPLYPPSHGRLLYRRAALDTLLCVGGLTRREKRCKNYFWPPSLNSCLGSLVRGQPGSLFGANWSWLHRYGISDVWLIFVSLYWEEGSKKSNRITEVVCFLLL